MVRTKRKRGGTKSESESGRNERGERTRTQSDDERVGRNERTRKESDDDRQRTGRRSRYESDQERHFNGRRSKSESERSVRRKRPPPARTWRQWAAHHKNKFIGVAALAAILATGAFMNPGIMMSPTAAYTYIATNYPVYAGIAKANITGIFARASGILSKTPSADGVATGIDPQIPSAGIATGIEPQIPSAGIATGIEPVSMPIRPSPYDILLQDETPEQMQNEFDIQRKAYNAQKGIFGRTAKLMHKGTKHGSRAAISGLKDAGNFITNAAANIAIYRAKETADKAIKYGINAMHDELLEKSVGAETANGINNSVPAGVVLTPADHVAASAHLRPQSGQMAVHPYYV